MKKKFCMFFLMLASVIACIVCLAACNNGDDNGIGEVQAEYVGEYEFYSIHQVLVIDGKEEVMDMVAGDGFVTKDYMHLSLNQDGSYSMSINDVDGTPLDIPKLGGKWGVKNNKLSMASNDNSTGGYNNVTLVDGILTMYGSNGGINAEIKLKKVVE